LPQCAINIAQWTFDENQSVRNFGVACNCVYLSVVCHVPTNICLFIGVEEQDIIFKKLTVMTSSIKTIQDYYEQLTAQPISSKRTQFIFDKPDYSNLCHFHIWTDGGHGLFGSDYIITKTDDGIIMRIRAISSDKIFGINTDKLDRKMTVSNFSGYLEIPIEDFLYLLSNGLWVVADNLQPK
jgi:hypothetical protein